MLKSIASVKIQDKNLLFFILSVRPFFFVFLLIFASRPANEPGGAYKTVYDAA